MHLDPSAYFSALATFAEKLEYASENPSSLSAIDIEMIILSGALYMRKLDEHGFLKEGFALAGRTINTPHGPLNVRTICDRLMHSRVIENHDLSAIKFRSDREGDVYIDVSSLSRTFTDYANASNFA